MSREEQINEAVNTYMNALFEDGVEIPIEDFENIAEGFIAGAQLADTHPKSPWIRVEDFLPCTNEKLVDCTGRIPCTKYVLVRRRNGDYSVDLMKKYGDGDWIWVSYLDIVAWMPIPEFK